MPKAYSYLRFSTPRQEWGDSTRRQRDMARDYATRHGLELADEELADKGVSGYSGANMTTDAALGQFLLAVQSGHIARGSILLVEALDRLSRQTALVAQHALTSVVLAGITVVTLNDERVYNVEELTRDPFALVYALVGFMRGHDESANKARRLRATWEEKRKKVARGEARLTRTCPAWLRWDEDSAAFVLIAERANVVRRLFTETLAGVGRHTLAQRLNAEGVPTFGSSQFWRPAYIATVLKNPACIGLLVPERLDYEEGTRKRGRLLCDPVPGYYPAVVDEETFRRVESMRTNARAAQRGRHAGAELANVFAGLLRCGRCGGAAILVNKGTNHRRGEKRPGKAVVCERAKNGAGCRYTSVKLERVEDAFRVNTARVLEEVPARGDAGAFLDMQLRGAEMAVVEAAARVEELIEDERRTRSLAVREHLRAAERELEEAKRERDAARARAETSRGPIVASKLADLEAALSADGFDRRAINAQLRQLFRGVVVEFDANVLRLEWAHGGEPTWVPYGSPFQSAEDERGLVFAKVEDGTGGQLARYRWVTLEDDPLPG